MTNLYRYSKMKIKILKDFDGFTKGSTVIAKEVNGIPAELYWRNRLKDAEIDGCAEIVKSKKKRGK